MNSFISKGYNKKYLKIANEARLNLQVELLSDITSADGKRIKGFVLKQQSRPFQEGWLRQTPLTKGQWNIWEAMVKETFTRQGSQHNLIVKQLGELINNPTNFWGISNNEQFLYYYTGNKLLQFQKLAS